MIRAGGKFDHVTVELEGETISHIRFSIEEEDGIGVVWYVATNEGFAQVDTSAWQVLETVFHANGLCGECNVTFN